MIYPGRRLHLIFLFAGLPCAIAASIAPSTGPFFLCLSLLFTVTAAVDALLCRSRSRSMSIRGPEIVRMYRAVPCRVNFSITTHGKTRGRILETAHPGFLLSQPFHFICEKDGRPLACELSIVPLERGKAGLASLLVRIDSPLSLWRRISRVAVATSAHVFANNTQDKHALKRMQSGDFAGGHLQRMVGKGREIDKLRDYVPGDGMEDIHWKATARHGRPISKEYRLERSQNIYLVIDASRSSARVVDYLTIGGREERLPVPLLERSIVAADILSIIANKQSDRIGLVAFDSRVRLFIKPDTGRHHLVACRNALVDLRSGSAPADYRELFQYLATSIRRRAMILILADFDDPFASERFSENVSILTKNHVVMGVCPVDDYVRHIFSSAIDSRDQLYRSLSGHLKWRAMQKVRQSIRTRGAEIVTSAPRDLTVHTIEAYATMKRHQRV